MKFYSKLLTAVAVAAIGTAVASADTIVLGSYGTANGSGGVMPAPLPNNNPVMYNNGKGLSSVFNIGSDGATTWTAAGPSSSWVSFDPNSGPTASPLSVDPNGIYEYVATFTAVGGNYFGTLSVLADDTVDVFLNGVKVINAGALGSDAHCADNAPNCLIPSTYSFTSLLAGTNTLTFDVHQTALVDQGFDFYGTATTTPEPGTLMLLGSGLVGSAGALLRRKRAQA